MNLSSEFDYHLNPAEQKQIEKLVPLHQAKIHMAFRANLQVDGKDYLNSAVALSEHMITLACHGFLGKNLKLFDTFHLFDITRVQTLNDETVRIDFNDKTIYIISTTCMRFTRNLIRNFILANPMLPSKQRFDFTYHDSQHFPPFNPPLSPSQLFQFTYNSYCSYFDTTYYHDIPMYYHNLLSSGNAIFDLTKLPIQILETGLGDSADIRPITSALKYSFYTYGFVCANFTRADIIESLVPLIKSNANLKMVRIVDAGCTKGAFQLAKAMLETDTSDVVYWDFSKNEIEDIGAFTAALGEYDVAVRSIRLDDCHMPAVAVADLWNSLAENESMHSIQQLSLIGSVMDEKSCENAVEFFNAIEDNETPSLKILGLGKLASPQQVIASFGIAGIALSRLSIHDTVFTDAAATELVEYVGSDAALEYLDLTGSTISNDLLLQLFETISESATIKRIELNLSRMKMKGDRFIIVMEALCGSLSSKLVGLYLDQCELTDVELSRLASSFKQLLALKKLSISRNFTRRTNNVGQLLASLLRINLIEELVIQGGDGFALEEELVPLICQAAVSSSLRKLDVSFNKIGDIGLDSITNLIITSKHIVDIAADGTNVDSFGPIERFMNAVRNSDVIVGAPLPVEDLYALLSNVPEKEQKKKIEMVSKLQAKVEKALLKNRCAAGLHSDLSLLHDPILDKLIDTVTLGLQHMLNESQLHSHLAITEIVGLPLPFDKDGQPSSTDRTTTPAIAGSDNENYVSPMMLSSVNEGIDKVTEQLQTLQFNSLLIRRPNAAERLKAKAHLALDDDYDEEESDDDSDGVRAFVRPTEFDFSKLTAPAVMEELSHVESDSGLTPIETVDGPTGPIKELGREDAGLESPLI